jgi:opacity protein-like surface antigen
MAMRGSRILIAAVAAAVVSTAPAGAADMPDSWMPDLKPSPYAELVSGWYFRGDFGYRWNSFGSVDAPTAVTSPSFDNAWTIGGGGGYKYHWFRTDVTVDYAQRADFRVNTTAPENFYSSRIDALTMLWNVYLDMGTWAGFTPYVGAGIGASYLRTAQFTSQTWQGTRDGRNWDLSWAVTGGVAFQISRNLLLDVNYRYLSLGDAVTETIPPPQTSRVTYRDLSAQEVRIGLRLLLD